MFHLPGSAATVTWPASVEQGRNPEPEPEPVSCVANDMGIPA